MKTVYEQWHGHDYWVKLADGESVILTVKPTRNRDIITALGMPDTGDILGNCRRVFGFINRNYRLFNENWTLDFGIAAPIDHPISYMVRDAKQLVKMSKGCKKGERMIMGTI